MKADKTILHAALDALRFLGRVEWFRASAVQRKIQRYQRMRLHSSGTNAASWKGTMRGV